MLEILIHAWCTGIFSSRKIAAGVEDRVPLRYLAAGHSPSQRTIARFRHEHLAAFATLFVQVVQIAGAAGLVKMGTVAVDGSRVKANASKHKAIVESVCGWVKHVLGFRSLSLRGHDKATAGWDLICLATNPRRMNGMMAWT